MWCLIRCSFSASNAVSGVLRWQSSLRSRSAIAPHSTSGFEVEDLVPVLAAVEDHEQLLRELLRLRQRQDLEHLVERAEAAGKNHQRLGQVGEPELAHEEVVELEVQALGDVAVGPLLERQADVEADALAAGLVGAAIGGLHDAGPAARADDEAVARFLERQAPFREQVRELARVLVVARPLAPPCGCASAPRRSRDPRRVFGFVSRSSDRSAILRLLIRAEPKNTTVS